MLNIVWAYPDILNLHGDRGNILALEKVAKMLKIETSITKIETYNEKIDFENTDIILFNSGETKVMPSIIEALKKQEIELKEYIEKGKIILLIGTTGCIMSNEILMANGKKIEGLGILDMQCKERECVYENDLYFTINEDATQIMANQVQLIDITLNSDIAYGTVKHGMGNNYKSTEGAKYKNVVFTNALGPVLVKNPWYAEKLIKLALENKNERIIKDIPKEDYELELKSKECMKEFISKKERKFKIV